MQKKLMTFIVMISIVGCAGNGLTPEQRVASWEDWELCHRLADFVYKGESQWLWYSADAIAERNLSNDSRCKSVYDARMQEYVRKYQSSDINISFGQAINNASFENVAPSN